jgi:hypothetical protein
LTTKCRQTLLTGDNDFKPLVDALVQDGMFVTWWFPPEETSRELMQAADSLRRLSMPSLRALLTPESQAIFQIPQEEVFSPPFPDPGKRLETWHALGESYGLYKSANQFVVTRTWGANTLYLRHTNYQLRKT